MSNLNQATTPSALLLQAETLAIQGNHASAIALLKNAIQQNPSFYQAWLMLSKMLFDSGFVEQALQVEQSAQQFDPLQSDFSAIKSKMQSNALVDASSLANTMLEKVSGHPRAIFTLAHIGFVQNRPEDSIAPLLEGIKISPANIQFRAMLTDAYASSGQYQRAIEHVETLLNIQNNFNHLWMLIGLLLKFGQYDKLKKLCETALHNTQLPRQQQSQLQLAYAQTLRILGKREQCINAFQQSLRDDPNNADAWWGLADMKNYAFSQHEREAIKRLTDSPSLPKPLKCAAAFALAKASEGKVDDTETMALYHKANGLRDTGRFSTQQFADEFSNRINTFNAKTLSVQAETLNRPVTPIFIVGLPRSGSTLIEQILASHSLIEGTLEQPTLAHIDRMAQNLCMKKFNEPMSQSLERLSNKDLAELGRAYIDNGKLFRKTDKPYFTDKLPFNFRHIGLIHKILPQAIIIDVRRDPLDCGLSLYKQYFPSGVEFSYDLQHIGAFYKAYVRLMAHWDSVLPNKVLRIHYESLVNEPQTVISALLNYIGVDFESACLEFHRSDRVVHTASSEQVRQPINRKGIGIAKSVEFALEPLINSLNDDNKKRD